MASRRKSGRKSTEPPRARSRAPRQPPPGGRQPLGSPGSGGAAFGAGGYGAYAGEGQFGGAYGGRSADTKGPHRAARPQNGEAARQPREPYIERKTGPVRVRKPAGPGTASQRTAPSEPARKRSQQPTPKGGAAYGGLASTGDYGYGARGEYGESQTGRDLPYGQEQSGSGGYTGYGTYGGGNEPARPLPSRRRRGKQGSRGRR